MATTNFVDGVTLIEAEWANEVDYIVHDVLQVVDGTSATATTALTVDSAQVTATGSTTARTLAARHAEIINVLDHGLKGDGTAETAANLTSAVNEWVGTGDDAADPAEEDTEGSTERILYFPAGTYDFKGNDQTITTTGSFQTVAGEGRLSVLIDIAITLDDRGAVVRDLYLAGGGTKTSHGVKLQRAARRFGSVENVYIFERSTGILIEDGGVDDFLNVRIERCGTGVEIQGGNVGATFTNVDASRCDDHCWFINKPGGGEIKMVNCKGQAPGQSTTGYGLYILGDENGQVVENYFTNCTFTQAPAQRSHTISSISDAGGGDITVVTATNHELVAGMNEVEINGTTSYDATYTVTAVNSATSFNVTATFVADESGTVDIPGWDVLIENTGTGGTNKGDTNDLWFTGGNINYLKVDGAFNVNFVNTRLKNQIWLSDVARLMILRNRRGRQSSGFADIPIGGVATGWAEFAYSGDNSLTPGQGYIVMSAPNSAGGLGSDNEPASKNEWRVREKDIVGRVADTTLFVMDTNSVWLGGSGSAAGIRARTSGASPVNYADIIGRPAGSPPEINAAGSDTNIDLELNAKGTGNIRFGTHTALGGESLSGYITIKDAGGTSRKIGVIS